MLWLKALMGIGADCLDDQDFFSGPCVRPRMVSVGRRIILGVINPSMKNELQELGTAWDMLEAIKARFSGVTKAKMLGVLQQLRNVEVNMSQNPARVATEMKTLLDELNAMGTVFHYDNLLPLIIHENVAPGTALRFEFDRRIDAEISLNNHQPITFEKTWKTLSAAIHQVESSQSLQSNKPQVHFNSTSAPMDRSASVVSHEDNVYVLAANPQATRNKYYRCKSFGHLLANCPLNNPATHRYPSHSQPPVPYPRSQQPAMQAFYPIISPAGSTPCYYPQRQPAPNPNLIPIPRPQDTYRPQYFQQNQQSGHGPGPSARAAGPSLEQHGPSFNNLDLNGNAAGDVNHQETLFDTGASHHLSGDNSGQPSFYWSQWNEGGP